MECTNIGITYCLALFSFGGPFLSLYLPHLGVEAGVKLLATIWPQKGQGNGTVPGVVGPLNFVFNVLIASPLLSCTRFKPLHIKSHAGSMPMFLLSLPPASALVYSCCYIPALASSLLRDRVCFLQPSGVCGGFIMRLCTQTSLVRSILR